MLGALHLMQKTSGMVLLSCLPPSTVIFQLAGIILARLFLPEIAGIHPDIPWTGAVLPSLPPASIVPQTNPLLLPRTLCCLLQPAACTVEPVLCLRGCSQALRASSYGSCRQKKEETMLILDPLCSPYLTEFGHRFFLLPSSDHCGLCVFDHWPHSVWRLCAWRREKHCPKMDKFSRWLRTPAKHPIWPFFVPSPHVPSLVCPENIHKLNIPER